MSPADLLARAGEMGFTLAVTDDGWAWVPTLAGARMPPPLMALLREHRAELVAHMTCDTCFAQTFDARMLHVLRSDDFCPRTDCPRKR